MSKARFHLTFPEHLIREPMVYRIGRDFDLVPNIRRANIEETAAWMIMDLEGADDDIARAIAWLEEGGVKVERIEGSN
jgi:ABC-type methionine transport system ATPase subunit